MVFPDTYLRRKAVIRGALVALGLVVIPSTSSAESVAEWSLGGKRTFSMGYFCAVRGPSDGLEGPSISFDLRYWGGPLGWSAQVEKPHGPVTLKHIELDGRRYAPSGPHQIFSSSNVADFGRETEDCRALHARRVKRRHATAIQKSVPNWRFRNFRSKLRI